MDKKNSSLPIGALLAVCFGSNLVCAPPATNASRVRTTQTLAAMTTDGDWASYNRTLIGDRFSPRNHVRTENAINLRMNRGVAFADVFRESAVRRAMVHIEEPKSRRRFLL